MCCPSRIYCEPKERRRGPIRSSGHRQTKPRSLDGPVCPVEDVEDVEKLFFFNADARIRHFDENGFLVSLNRTLTDPPSFVYLTALSRRFAVTVSIFSLSP